MSHSGTRCGNVRLIAASACLEWMLRFAAAKSWQESLTSMDTRRSGLDLRIAKSANTLTDLKSVGYVNVSNKVGLKSRCGMRAAL